MCNSPSSRFENQGQSGDFAALPAALTARPQWVRWCSVPRPDGKPDKVPYTPTGKNASSTNPRTWSTFLAILESYRESDGGQGGIGFVPLPQDGLVLIDLDNCRDPATGAVADWAQSIVRDFNTRTEISPSRTGLHLIAFGRKPGRDTSAACGGGKVEMYDGLTKDNKPGGRFLAMTGVLLEGPPATINDCQAQIDALYAKLFGAPTKPGAPPDAPQPPSGAAPAPGWPEELGPLLEVCATAPVGKRSERDFHLCAKADRLNVPDEVVWQRVQMVGKFAEKGHRYFATTMRNAGKHNRAHPLPRFKYSPLTATPTAEKGPGQKDYTCRHSKGNIFHGKDRDGKDSVGGYLFRCLCASKCPGCRNYIADQAAAHFTWTFGEAVAAYGCRFWVLPNVCPTDRRAWGAAGRAVRKIDGALVQPLGGRLVVAAPGGASLTGALAGASPASLEEAIVIMTADFDRAAPQTKWQRIGNWSNCWALRHRKKTKAKPSARKKRWAGKLAILDNQQNARLLAQLGMAHSITSADPTPRPGGLDRFVSAIRARGLSDAGARRVINALKEGAANKDLCAHKSFSPPGGPRRAYAGPAHSGNGLADTG
jgi:hypothetical protein